MNEEQLGCLYFIRSEAQEAVKIGFAKDPEARLGILQTGNPSKLKLYQTFPATLAVEQAIHTAFRDYAIKGEWYPDISLWDCLIDDLGNALLDRMDISLLPFLDLWEYGDAVLTVGDIRANAFNLRREYEDWVAEGSPEEC